MQTKAKQVLLICLVTSHVLALVGVSTAQSESASNTASVSLDEVIVETVYGEVLGAVGADVIAYKGIPYAAPPVGELRWRAPQPPLSWIGVRDATEPRPACPQAWAGETSGSEDCLYLNVWAPREQSDELLPVFFWIHGGGFVNGDALNPREDGSNLARNGMIVVTANYRIGRFGFFAHPALTSQNSDDGRLANYGILDQIAALEWVRRNIDSFGGDPANVTIAGQSAGAVSVQYLMTSPLARGLFSRAIAQSGSLRSSTSASLPFRPMRIADGARNSAESRGVSFAAQLGVNGTGPESLAALRSLSATEIVAGLSMMTLAEQGFGGPIRDGVVLPTDIETAYRLGKEASVPLIIGANDADGFYPWFGGTREEIFSQFGEFRHEAEDIYTRFGANDTARIGTYVDADQRFIEPARRIARFHTANGHPTYHYRFSYVPEHQRTELFGATHSSDIQFVFGTIATFFSPTESDQLVSRQMRAYWTSFARDGVPNPEGLPAWPSFDPDEEVILDLGLEGPVIGPDPIQKRLDFVQRVFDGQ